MRQAYLGSSVTPVGIVTPIFSMCEEQEPNEVLQRFRGLLGYGPGWTFWAALREWAVRKIALPVAILLVVAMCTLPIWGALIFSL